MQGYVVFGLLTLVSTTPAVEAQEADPLAAGVHVVRPGETLWELAGRYLSDPFLWTEIHALNSESIPDPHRIYPEARLRLPASAEAAAEAAGVAEQANAGDASATAATSEPPAPADTRSSEAADGEPTIFAAAAAATSAAVRTMSTAATSGPTAHATGVAPNGGDGVRAQAAPPVPSVPRGSFYGASLLAPEAEIAAIGELFDVVSSTSVPRGVDPQIHPYDRVLVRVTTDAAVGERVHFMRPGHYVLPHGRVYHATGQGLILAIVDGTAIVELDRLYGRVEKGDLALRTPVYRVPAGAAQPASGLDGTIIDLAEPQPVASVEDLAFVNLGEESGVSLGDEFEVYVPFRATEAGVLPEFTVGRVQVVRTTRTTSTVRVVSLEQPLLRPGLPVRLVARVR